MEIFLFELYKYSLYILGFRRLFSPVGSVCTIQIYTKRRGYPLGVASHKPVNLKLFFDGCLRRCQTNILINKLAFCCKHTVNYTLLYIELLHLHHNLLYPFALLQK